MIQSSSLKKIVFLLVIFFFITNSIAQFNVVSTSPVNGATNVDKAATMSITFNAAIDTSARFLFPGGLFISLFFTPDSLVHEPDSITFSPDMHTVYFHNLHLSDFTLYRFCILNAISISGDSLDVPNSFTFSTTSILPGFYATLSGMIDYPGSDPTGAMVFLFKSNPFEDEESRIENWAVVSNSSGMFTIDYVDSGFCWPAVIKDFYLDEDGEIQIIDGSKIGYFDHGGDLRPDSNYVFIGSTVTGLDMTLYDVYLQSARNPLTNLGTIVQNWTTDAHLVEFGCDEIMPDGNAMFWQYTYYSPSVLNSKIWMTVGDLIISIKDDSINTDKTALPLNWINSDTIMATAEANGGMQFRQQYFDARVNAGCGYFIPSFGKYKFKVKNNKFQIKAAVWNIEYQSYSSWQYFNLFIDAVTGAILNMPATAAESEQAALPIAQDWAPDVKLWRIENQGSTVDTSGKTDYWGCIYYSSQKDSLHEIDLWGLLPYWAGTPASFSADSTTIVQGWINSDVAMDSAEIRGGSDYRQNNQQIIVNAALGQWYNGVVPDSIVWHITYYSSTSNPLEIVLDPYTFQSSVDPDVIFTPNVFMLHQNYPNPFNPVTTIAFNLPIASNVSFKIFNVVGQAIETINLKNLTAGEHQISWNASHMPSGVYFYKIIAREFSAIKKCIFLK